MGIMKTIKVREETWERVTELRNLIVENGLNNFNISDDSIPKGDFSKLTRDIVIEIALKEMINSQKDGEKNHERGAKSNREGSAKN